MSKKAIGKIIPAGKARTRYIVIPADLAGDDRFPFEDNEEVQILIDERKNSLSIVKNTE